MTTRKITPSGTMWGDVLPPKLRALRAHISDDVMALYDEIISDVASMNCDIAAQSLEIERLRKHVHSLERIMVDIAKAHVAFHDTCSAACKKYSLPEEYYEDADA